ncbi:MAG: methionyl-tRNA formyltransferase [Lachnospiraceae bacterium]|nr:methionyl-tRNA formyltransferase [Lachnospiraceae bacterium]
MKIVFMGTPDFAAGALRALLLAGHQVTAVVTQPDKPKGRSKELQFPPVKECALEHGIPVLQPVRIKTPEAIAELKKYEADIYIVAAFGQILSQEILDIPRYGCLNIHASLLPKYRGASPIQHVIIDGEWETGVTIMQMDAGLDTGDMLYKKHILIEEDDTFETLHDKLMVLGGEAIVEALPLLRAGKLMPEVQEDAESCYAPLIKKEMGELDFHKDAVTLNRLIRGMNPWPSAYTFYKGKQLKIWQAEPVTADIVGACKPGEIINVTKDRIEVACGEGVLAVKELQLEGKKRMSTHDFLLGVKIVPGDRFDRKGV